MGTNCAPLLADLFLHSYEAEFVHKLLRDNNKKLAVSFNHTFRYIDHVFQQSVGIPMGTNFAPLLADLFLFSYEAEFVQELLRDNNKKKTRRVL